MSDYSSTLPACPNLQNRLVESWKYNPARILGNIGMLDALTSPMNKAGVTISQQVSPGNGKYRTVDVVYPQRILISQVGSDTTQVCESVNEDGLTSEQYTIDTTVGSEINRVFRITDHQDTCQTLEDWIIEKIGDYLMALDRKVNKDSFTQTAAFYGSFASTEENVTGDDGAAQIKTVYTRKSGGVDRDTNALEMLKFATKNAAYPSAPIIIGWDEIDQYFEVMKNGCCADNGLDFGAIMRDTGMVYVSDENAPDVFAGNTTDFLSMAAGAAQLITFNKFKGSKGYLVVDDESYKQTIIRSPRTGIEYDLVLKNDCGNIHIQLAVAHVVKALPDDMFQHGDRLRGVRWINRWRPATRA